MSYTETDYVTVTAANQFDTPIYMPKDSKPSSETYNINIFQRIANSLLWLKNQVDNAVKKTGNHTMAGNLTIPDGTAAGHAVNKGQLDAAVAAPTYGGDANDGWRLDPRDNWAVMWFTVDMGDISASQTVTIDLPFTLTTAPPVVHAIADLKGGTVADSYPSLKSKTTTQVILFIDEITALVQDQRLRVTVEGKKA